MASDRFIYFKRRRPTKEELRLVLGDFFRGLSKSPPRWRNDRWFIYLPGRATHPLKRVLPKRMECVWKSIEEQNWPRFIEVWPGKNMRCIDVMTRFADDPTNALATRLVEVIARYWKGRVDAG